MSTVTDFAAAAKKRKTGWFRFFVPLDGTAIALEIRVEASGQASRLRVCDQQTATLDEKPRLRTMLIHAADNTLALLNLLLDENDMSWETLRCFRNSSSAIGAIIEAADNRLTELARRQDDDGA